MKTENINAIGSRMEMMYHVATAIHDMASELISNCPKGIGVTMLCAIEELAKGQARELEAISEYMQGREIGYYASHFDDKDATLIVANAKQEKAE